VFDAYRSKGADMSALTEILAAALNCRAGESLDALFALLAKVYPNTKLGAYGADKTKCAEMAASVAANQQRLLVNNPVALSEQEIAAVYERCL
jgi:4-hydroxybutyrate dehydrogenase